MSQSLRVLAGRLRWDGHHTRGVASPVVRIFMRFSYNIHALLSKSRLFLFQACELHTSTPSSFIFEGGGFGFGDTQLFCCSMDWSDNGL
jgi:hypothetical protein